MDVTPHSEHRYDSNCPECPDSQVALGEDGWITLCGARYDPAKVMVWVQLPIGPQQTINAWINGVPPGQPDTHVTAKVPLLALLASFNPVVRRLADWLSQHGEEES